MVALIETLGFCKSAAKQAVRYEQIKDMDALLSELSNFDQTVGYPMLRIFPLK